MSFNPPLYCPLVKMNTDKLVNTGVTLPTNLQGKPLNELCVPNFYGPGLPQVPSYMGVNRCQSYDNGNKSMPVHLKFDSNNKAHIVSACYKNYYDCYNDIPIKNCEFNI